MHLGLERRPLTVALIVEVGKRHPREDFLGLPPPGTNAGFISM